MRGQRHALAPRPLAARLAVQLLKRDLNLPNNIIDIDWIVVVEPERARRFVAVQVKDEVCGRSS